MGFGRVQRAAPLAMREETRHEVPGRTQAELEVWREAAAARRGCPRAMGRLACLMRPRLLAMARRMLLDRADAEDAVQDALLDMLSAMHGYDTARSPLPLMRTVLHRRAMDILRRSTRRARAEAVAAVEDVTPSIAFTVVLMGEIAALLDGLPGAQAEAIRLTGIEGLSLAAAAEHTGRSPNALKVSVHRGTSRLREALAMP